MVEKSDKSWDIARHLLASAEFDRISSYVSRGRFLQDLSPDALQQLFLERIRAYADALPGTEQALAMPFNDVEAEYSLRDLESPLLLALPELEKIKKRSLAWLRTLSEKETEAINDHLLREYDADLAAKN